MDELQEQRTAAQEEVRTHLYAARQAMVRLLALDPDNSSRWAAAQDINMALIHLDQRC